MDDVLLISQPEAAALLGLSTGGVDYIAKTRRQLTRHRRQGRMFYALAEVEALRAQQATQLKTGVRAAWTSSGADSTVIPARRGRRLPAERRSPARVSVHRRDSGSARCLCVQAQPVLRSMRWRTAQSSRRSLIAAAKSS